jgi:hypothetical protein
MDARHVGSLPARPPSVAEWEELLLRMEIMPRALRITLEETGRDPDAAAELLRGVVEREVRVSAWLTAASEPAGGEPGPGPEVGDTGAQTRDPRWLAERFASLRARNFAMLQRRGLNVWDWVAPLEDDGTVTAHQVVTALVQLDTAALGTLRGGASLGSGAC